MARFDSILSVIILSGFINLSAASKDACDLHAVVGQSLTLPFRYEGLTNSDALSWTHNSTDIFNRKQGRVSIGKSEDISTAGSLLLGNLQFSSAGIYRADVLNPNGTLAKTWTAHVCMVEKVPKPQLTYRCESSESTAVNLNCQVSKPQGLVFSWTLDEKTLTGETRQTLRISLEQLKGERSFTCSVANKASKEESDTVRPNCKSPPLPTLFCYTSKTVVAVLAGGAGLILVLFIIIIILCCYHRRIKPQIGHMDGGELRILSVDKRSPGSISPEYETMHPTEESPPVRPKSSARVCYENVSQPESQPENSPAQLFTNAEGQQPQPSPVPKPRTKSPQTPNI